MQLPTPGGHSWPARLAYIAAGLFSLASGGTNLIYGWSKGTDLGSSMIWAAVSVGVSIVFALSWPALIRSIDAKQWTRAAMVGVALLVTGAYSISAALGSASGGRANAAIEEKDITDKRTRAQASYDATSVELANLKPSRPVAEMEVLVEAAKPVCRIVVGNGYRGETCNKPPALTAELGRAKRRAELEQKIEQAATILAATGPAKVANSDAVALASYMQALGFTIDADRVNKLLVLLALLVVECGGGLALAVEMALSEGGRSEPVSTVGVNGVRSGVYPAVDDAVDTCERPRGEPLTNGADERQQRGGRSARTRVLQVLIERGGVLTGSQQAMSTAFGWSKNRMNAVLHDLKAAGLVRLSTGKGGTVVKLVEGGRA